MFAVRTTGHLTASAFLRGYRLTLLPLPHFDGASIHFFILDLRHFARARVAIARHDVDLTLVVGLPRAPRPPGPSTPRLALRAADTRERAAEKHAREVGRILFGPGGDGARVKSRRMMGSEAVMIDMPHSAMVQIMIRPLSYMLSAES